MTEGVNFSITCLNASALVNREMTEVAKFVEIVEKRASSSEILYDESRTLTEDTTEGKFEALIVDISLVERERSEIGRVD